VGLVRALPRGLRLRPNFGGAGVYSFGSFDEDGQPGTGSLGEGCGSAGDVNVATVEPGPFAWDLRRSELTFTVGPRCAGMYLISGSMWVDSAGEEGLRGTIKAGFVNLRSTMRGTWETDKDGLAGALLVHFRDMVSTNWTWHSVV